MKKLTKKSLKFITAKKAFPKNFLKDISESHCSEFLENTVEFFEGDELEKYVRYIIFLSGKFVSKNKTNMKVLTQLQLLLTYIIEYVNTKEVPEDIIVSLESTILLVEAFRRDFDILCILKNLNFYKDASYKNTVESISDYYSDLVEQELFSRDYKDNYEVI